ncbi:hypothetical protein EYF80_035028 [Liparis tanakae]|uniref:Uncharacterized protein n=1 Tax=Liparis tanakae TaxID=230148 RepID=A0A4Z2GNM0_9TELE|nr:hypothetical protein EYF80_035028 [Liparis tanakae]
MKSSSSAHATCFSPPPRRLLGLGAALFVVVAVVVFLAQGAGAAVPLHGQTFDWRGGEEEEEGTGGGSLEKDLKYNPPGSSRRELSRSACGVKTGRRRGGIALPRRERERNAARPGRGRRKRTALLPSLTSRSVTCLAASSRELLSLILGRSSSSVSVIM